MSDYMEYGIDLGTTNSVVARVEGGGARIFQNNDLMNVTPSAVRVRRNGQIIVGKRAYNGLVDDPDNVAVEFKRWMGQKDKKRFVASGRELSPEQLSAEILKSLREDVQRAVGASFDAAVITVPAAFGALQCDATSRAARLAGIETCTLLQEPIAAAVAYGADGEKKDERWLVYDLGGGTLDIAVASTRDGRLSIIEHRGDNVLGGKDIDRLLVEQVILPALRGSFKLPDPHENAARYELLVRRLGFHAEDAKIQLSSAPEVTISLFDIGDDLEGNPIELEVALDRARLDTIIEPLIRRTLDLADETLKAARLTGADLSQVLLVGGPTQIPYLRKRIGEHLGAQLNFSLDPMTVVARGAAFYAQQVELESKASAPVAAGVVKVRLAYEPVSVSLETTVAGKIEMEAPSDVEVRIESQAGYWSSGWVPAHGGLFEIDVVLQEGKVCPFYLYVRDAQGKTLSIEPNEFTIRHGMPVSAPPLPHTISVEVVKPSGRVELDPIFPRNSPLPAERRLQYRSDCTIRPGEKGAAITVKLWEGEDLIEPEANDWVGNVQITSNMIRRPIPEDSDLDLFIRIDASRLITVEIFVPLLNQHFTEGVYLAEQEQRDQGDALAKLSNEIAAFGERLKMVESYLATHPSVEVEEELSALRRQVWDLDIDVNSARRDGAGGDPDRPRRFAATSRNLRGQLGALERRLQVDHVITSRVRRPQEEIDKMAELVERNGEATDRFEFELIRKDIEAAAERIDERGVRKGMEDLNQLQLRILFRQDWFWREIFESMDKSEAAFVMPAEAARWVRQGEQAVESGNSASLQEAVRNLWRLQTVGAAEAGRQIAQQTGLRK